MCVKLNSLFDREMKVFYVTQVLKQGIIITAMCFNYKKSHLLQVYLGACVEKAEFVIENHVY